MFMAEAHEVARDLFQEAYLHQMRGELELAVRLYKRSIRLYPTAEACTFLGWTYSFQDRPEAAIAECKNAILIDPGYGNPYNDIGSYLIGLGRFEEAIPWLERAIASRRYASYHYAWYNLGRAYAAQDRMEQASACFDKALEIEPGYRPAREAQRALGVGQT
jgi:tetratricopeptide (TPR) repeat protein